MHEQSRFSLAVEGFDVFTAWEDLAGVWIATIEPKQQVQLAESHEGTSEVELCVQRDHINASHL